MSFGNRREVSEIDEKLKKRILECKQTILSEKMSGESAAAYACGYLHRYPELSELLGVIAKQEPYRQKGIR